MEGSSHLCNMSLEIKDVSHCFTDVEMGGKNTLADEWRKTGELGVDEGPAEWMRRRNKEETGGEEDL